MHKIRKFGIVTLALAALAAALPQAASASGSIRSITAYQTDMTGFRTYGPDDIVHIGDYIAFKVRLLNYNTNCTPAGGLNNPWVFRRTPVHYPDYSSLGDDLTDQMMVTNYLPKMGLWISGHKRFATLKSCNLVDGYYTELVFEYKAQSGDMGMPVKFCNRYGTNEILNSPDQQYLLENVGPSMYWELVDATTGTRCEYTFGSMYLDPSGSTDNFEYAPPGWSSANEVYDYDLSQAQMYIRTVDFDEALSDAWRTIYENKSTTVEGKLPTLVIPKGAYEASTVYLWTEDSDVAVLANGGERVYHALTPDKSTYKDYTVYTANIVHEESFPFKVKGIRGASGRTTTIYLSSTPTNIYNSAGTRIINFVERTILVTNQPNPVVNIELDKTSITCDSAYGTSKALLTVTVDAFTNAITVALNPTIGGAALGSGLLSISESADGALNPYSTTFTYPARSSTDEEPAVYKYYVFGLGFVTNDTYSGTSQTVLFSPTITGDGGVFGAIDSFTLNVKEAKPSFTISNLSDEGNYATAQADFPLTLNVADSYANLHDATIGYTVYWKPNSLTPNWQLVKSGVKVVDGELDVVVKYTSGGSFTSQVRIYGPDGQRCDVDQSFNVTVAEAKRAVLSVDMDGDDEMPRTYYEGDPVKKVRVLLQNWKNDTGANLYAFLEPQGDTANYISIEQFIVGHSNCKGLKIEDGGTNTVSLTKTFRALDGDKSLSFRIVIASVENWSDVTVDNTIFTYDAEDIEVANVQPTFDNVIMKGGKVLTAGDGTEVQKTDRGLIRTFTWAAYDVDADLSSLKTRWTVKDPYGSQVDQKTFTGDPVGQEYKYTFVDMTSAGQSYTVTVEMQDKDMGSREWTKFEFKVEVGEESRTLFMAPDDTELVDGESYRFLEDAVMNDLYDFFKVGISTAAKDPIVIKVTKTPIGGCDGSFNMIGADDTGTLYVTIPAGRTISSKIDLTEMLDGTRTSADKQHCFELVATVTNTNLSADGVPYNEIYKPTAIRVLVDNVPPTVNILECNGMPYIEGTNGYCVVDEVTAYSTVTVNWNFDDVPADVNSDKFVVQFTSSLLPGGSYTTNSPVGSLEFQLDKTGGYLTLNVRDKDSIKNESFKWLIQVVPSKNVQVSPIGPITSGQSKKSEEYRSASGAGQGRVYVLEGEFQRAQQHTHYYTFWPESSSADVWAWGYRVGDVDDGSLPDHDRAINPSGNNDPKSPPTTFYNYNVFSDEKDSFFYAWVINQTDDQNVPTGIAYTSPQIGTNSVVRRTCYFGEDTEENDDSIAVYPPIVLEAAFSVEQYPADNLGDINSDDIPDVFAVAKSYSEGYLYAVANGGGEGGGSGDGEGVEGDMKNLRGFNDDEDYLPAPTSAGNSLIPNVVGSWATTGAKFTAYYETRGFGPGLNYRRLSDGLNYNVRGEWISEPDFTDAEKAAYIRYCLAQGVDTNSVDIFSIDFLNTVKWSPENRTDPTIADTDGDDLPDGYEYFFWYRALVGDSDGNQMVGSRFNPNNIAQGIDITPEEIVAAFNPTVGSNSDALERDTDGDGLTDLEELAIGTNPVHWDTDGDGMSDLYEVMWLLNPLKTPDEEKPDKNPDGDYMASWTSDKTWAVITIPNKGIYAVDEATTILNGFVEGEKKDEGTLDTGAGDVTIKAIPVFWYGADGSTPVPKSRKGCLTNFVDVVAASNSTVTVVRGKPLRLIHEQVFDAFDFDPRTGWYSNSKGACGDRWTASGGGSTEEFSEGASGYATNTVGFTSLDEYLLCKYRKETGATGGSDLRDDLKASYASVRRTVAKLLWTGCTAPKGPVDPKAYSEDLTEEFGFPDIYGADTDGDGVPDGWELYVGANPNESSDGPGNQDGDELSLVEEFAGTDSCNAYSNTPSIYAHHTGNNSGWYNKFFPTNPKNPDTDGDGVSDSDEGKTWQGSFHSGRSGGDTESMSVTFTFIYGPRKVGDSVRGMPESDDGSRCIRGGGLNPCTVDTDLDLLPDGWERQFAGLVFDSNGQPEGNSPAENIIKRLRFSDGLDSATGEELHTPVGYYISGGMDGTYGPGASQPGDAFTSFAGGEKVEVTDPRTGTCRNYDWDNDGLENFQEYLVQTLRHLRYDDTETPLMGAQLFYSAVGCSRLAFNKCIPFQAFDGTAFYETCRKAGFKATSAWNFRKLGYFARPPHEWDRLALNTRGNDLCMNYEDYEGTGYRILLPPKGLSYEANINKEDRFKNIRYVCTDPRRWDTDDDGLDDYWELFHGLNPLLGKAEEMNLANDVIANAYGGVPNAWVNAWTGWPLIFASQPEFDAFKYPWMIGTPECDADGDGIRNAEEGLFVNITSPSQKHTDPTPLWMTDKTSPTFASFTSQYYRMDPYMDPDNMGLADLFAYPWGWASSGGSGASDGQVFNFMFSFEENEGYDTDSDRRSDSAEGVKMVENASDPLKFSDLDRRQALYLPGLHESIMNPGKLVGSAVVSRGGSDTMQQPISTSYDLLRQFTVEAWVKPEKLDCEQVILERVSNYGASTLSNNTAVIRANFRLGIDTNGMYYAEFEGNAADSGVQRLVGATVSTNEWTHLAFTFDGSTFAMYVNDVEWPVAKAENISLIPANGIVIIKQEAGSPEPVQSKGYTAAPCAFIIGARAVTGDAIALSKNTEWDAFGDYYTGWIDEVRVWDGARTGSEIAADYQARYSFDDVKNRRQAVYQSWRAGATRNDVAGKVLPVELLQHYNFCTLAGATAPEAVIHEPLQFTENVLDNVRIDGQSEAKLGAGGLNCGWWLEIPVHSEVYSDYHTIPWVQNTCAHLPIMDGSVPDSMYWCENFGGLVPASTAYSFSNTANPYPFYNYMVDRAAHFERLKRFATGSNSPYSAFQYLYQFQLRSGFVGTSDLVPLGGAYAKRSSELWDGGAADAWTQTEDDSDSDGLPDWWENFVAGGGNSDITYVDDDGHPLAAGNITWSAVVWRNGIKMTLAEAYQRDLAEGMVHDWDTDVVTVDKTYSVKATVDDNKNGLPDWWEKLYAIFGEGSFADHDNDQLSNYAEFLVSEGFTLVNGVNRKGGYDGEFKTISPINMRTYHDTEGQLVPDYFRRVGSLYLGEMFTDHDFMEDWWERYINDVSYASQYNFDPLKDADGDGWSNFAECRHSLWKALTTSDLNDRWLDNNMAHVACRPEPAIGMRVTYHGNKDTDDVPLVVRVSTDNVKTRDAVFTVHASSVKQQSGESYIGPYRKNTVIHGHLNPGNLVIGSGQFYRVPLASDKKYQWSYWYYNAISFNVISYGGAEPGYGIGTFEEYLSESAKYPHIELINLSQTWKQFASTQPKGTEGIYGQIIYSATAASNGTTTVTSGEIGTINYRTGEYEIDTAKLAAAEGSTSELEASVFMVKYNYRLGKEWPQTVYLSQPDVSAERAQQSQSPATPSSYSTQTSSGYIHEGTNVVSAFFDMDGNGKWTAGEPYGVTRVNVGWWKASTEIELTDTSPSMARFDLSSYASSSSSSGSSSGSQSSNISDRDANGFLYDNVTASNSVLSSVAASAMRIRVVRDAFNGESYLNPEPTFREVVLDRTINAELRPVFSEADLLAENLFDLDWGTVLRAFNASGVGSSSAADLRSVTYRVFVGNGDIIAPDDDTSILPKKFVNAFEPTTAQSPTTPLTPSGIIDSGRPTFTWRHDQTVKDYPAFRLRVYKANGSTVVYDSGICKAPPRDANGVYSWTAPLYANMVTALGEVFATTNNYQWAVSMLDAKFTSFRTSETKKPFRLECSGASGSISEYGSIDLQVKYFGPGTVNTDAVGSRNSLIRVQAFDTPDFSGDPAGEAYVTDVSTLASTTNLAYNARVIGLKPGTYYVRAFIDTNGDGIHQDWESWGYANYVGTEQSAVYNPKGLTIKGDSISVPSAAIYIEDADTDNDGFPDVYEWDQNGGLDFIAPATGNTFFTEVNPDLLATLKAYSKLGLEVRGGSSQAPVFRLMSAATSSASGLNAFNALFSGPETVENETDVSVVIDSFSLEDGMTISIDPAVSAGESGILSVSTTPILFNLELKHKASLAEAGWDTVASVPITLKANEPVTLTGDDLAVLREKIAEIQSNGGAGFFKVVLTK